MANYEPGIMDDTKINPATDRDGWLIERNRRVTTARLSRIAADYASATTENPDVLSWVQRVHGIQGSEWLLITGPVGTGKTHAAIAALRLLIDVPKTVVWNLATCSQMLEDFRPGGQDDADARYLRSDLLIIDDIAMVKANTEWAIEQIFRVIDDRRRNGRITVITSNEPPMRLKNLLNEQIVSRIVQRCTVIALTGEDRRRAKPREARS